MKEYPKIETLWARDEKTRRVIPGNWRMPEFGLVRDWQVTEKIDGTNIRIGLNPNGTVPTAEAALAAWERVEKGDE